MAQWIFPKFNSKRPWTLISLLRFYKNCKLWKFNLWLNLYEMISKKGPRLLSMHSKFQLDQVSNSWDTKAWIFWKLNTHTHARARTHTHTHTHAHARTSIRTFVLNRFCQCFTSFRVSWYKNLNKKNVSYKSKASFMRNQK